MRNIVLSVFFTLSILSASAQSYALFKKQFLSQKKIEKIEDIKTKNDFNQSSLSVSEIDNRIKTHVAGQVQQIETPINLKKLKYWGKLNPLQVINFDSTDFVRDMPMVNKDMEIYSYDSVWIFVLDKSNKSYLNVFFTARAIEIIKWKYPEAYSCLLRTNQRQLGLDYYNQNPFVLQPNVVALTPIISFDKSPSYIAGSLWDWKWAPEPPTIDYGRIKVYENTLIALTSLDYEKGRPAQIYTDPDTIKNYWLYLKEGLIESIVHEFTHHYVSTMQCDPSLDKKAKYIYSQRNDLNDKDFDFDVEEGIVLNTTKNYFKAKGGLSSQLVSFYDKKLDTKKQRITDTANSLNKVRYNNLQQLSLPGAKGFDEIYSLNIRCYDSVQTQDSLRSQQLSEQQRLQSEQYTQQLEQQRQLEDLYNQKIKNDPDFRKLIEAMEKLRQQQEYQQSIQQEQQMNFQNQNSQRPNPNVWQQIQQPVEP